MRTLKRAIAIVALVALCASGAAAQYYHAPPPAEPYEATTQAQPIQRTRNPRLVGTALLINLFYVPAHLVITALGGFLGGLAGFVTFGDLAAAESMWALTNGSAVITPEMLEGTEQYHFSGYD